MPVPMTAPKVLDREFFEIRAKLLEIAASFDRLDRGAGTVEGDPRMSLIREALDVLRSDEPDRAEAIQMIFSRQYAADWRKSLKVVPPKG
ncbi:MAG: hypothetical protein KY476_08450 [Planctomycetes bacterium]|nr:hypothetical protein [Planctomycetota bacterium]